MTISVGGIETGFAWFSFLRHLLAPRNLELENPLAPFAKKDPIDPTNFVVVVPIVNAREICRALRI